MHHQNKINTQAKHHRSRLQSYWFHSYSLKKHVFASKLMLFNLTYFTCNRLPKDNRLVLMGLELTIQEYKEE